jgi:hypothetical protein
VLGICGRHKGTTAAAVFCLLVALGVTLLLVLVAGARTSSVATAASPASATCSTDVQNAYVGTPGVEQSVAVDPLDTNTVLIGSLNGTTGSSYLYSAPAVSHQCGLTGTWAAPTGGLDGFQTCTGDQSVAWDRHGNAYFSCDGTEVYHSSDGGNTWGTPVPAATPAQNMGDAIDRPWLAVDNTGGPRDGTVYLVYESFFTNPLGWVMVVSSTNQGQTWSLPNRVDYPTSMPQTQADPRNFPAIGADGSLYVVYDQGTNPWAMAQMNPINLIVAHSTDGGKTFTHTLAATVPHPGRSSSPEEEGEMISSLAADPSPQRASHLALAWADERSGTSRILFEDSVNSGVSWTKPVDVADDPAGNKNEHDHPQVVFLPDGRAVVVWRDRRCCGGTWKSNYEIFARVLTIGDDGSVTPGNTVKVTNAPQVPNSSTMLNEYIGVSSGVEGVNVAWDQTVNGTTESFYRRLPLSDFPTPGSSPPSTTTGTSPATSSTSSTTTSGTSSTPMTTTTSSNAATTPTTTTPTTTTPTTGTTPSKPPKHTKPKPKPRGCRRNVALGLPVLGEHPDLDGDNDDNWRVVDGAVFAGGRIVGVIRPRRGHLPRRRITVPLSGPGRVLVTITVELSRGRDGQAVMLHYLVPVCTASRRGGARVVGRQTVVGGQ